MKIPEGSHASQRYRFAAQAARSSLHSPVARRALGEALQTSSPTRGCLFGTSSWLICCIVAAPLSIGGPAGQGKRMRTESHPLHTDQFVGKGRVLIVEDEVLLCMVLEDALSYEGYTVVGVARTAR